MSCNTKELVYPFLLGLDIVGQQGKKVTCLTLKNGWGNDGPWQVADMENKLTILDNRWVKNTRFVTFTAHLSLPLN